MSSLWPAPGSSSTQLSSSVRGLNWKRFRKRGVGMREILADLCHRQWSGWMEYLFSKGSFNPDGSWTMPKEFVDRWSRQMNTSYKNLFEEEQDSDRKEADKFIDVFGRS